MNEKILKNIKEMTDLVEQTKKSVADSIYEDVMNGNFTISEENQKIVKTMTTMETLIKNLTGNAEFPSLSEVDSSRTNNEEDKTKLNEKSNDKDAKETVLSVGQMEDETVEEINKINEVKDNLASNKNNDEEIKNKDNKKNSENKDIEDSILNIDEEEKNNIENKAEIIGEHIIANEEEPYYGKIFNEKRKLASDFIFNKYKIMATHWGYSSSSEISLFVAPLQVKQNNPNVPIIVHAYCAGKYITASSYDTKEEGHSIVTIMIDDFNLLIRGSFTDGVFKSSVVTTGISANQGDMLNIVSKETGYEGNNPKGSGHIKFKDNNDIYEIFPLSLTENEYLCIHISKEFLDYYVVAKYGIPKVRIINNGLKQEIVAGWSGKYFDTDII